jgi:hypothetical protein
MRFYKTVLIFSCMVAAASSQAGLYEFEANPTIGGSVGNQVEKIHSTFDSNAQKFTWDVDFVGDPTPIDGFWLVVNAGENPKASDVNELAIIYGDMATGIASTYVYNGANSATSINSPAILLQTDTFDTSSDSLRLDISTNTINEWTSPDPDYTGISYSTRIGVWFHVATGSNFTYNTDGDIIDFSFANQGWFDINNGVANEVTSPGSFAILGLSLLGMAFYRRKS